MVGTRQAVVYQMRVMVYQMQEGFQTWDDGGTRQWMMRYQTGDDGVPGRGRVTTLTGHQSEILHSLIFFTF